MELHTARLDYHCLLLILLLLSWVVWVWLGLAARSHETMRMRLLGIQSHNPNDTTKTRFRIIWDKTEQRPSSFSTALHSLRFLCANFEWKVLWESEMALSVFKLSDKYRMERHEVEIICSSFSTTICGYCVYLSRSLRALSSVRWRRDSRCIQMHQIIFVRYFPNHFFTLSVDWE